MERIECKKWQRRMALQSSTHVKEESGNLYGPMHRIEFKNQISVCFSRVNLFAKRLCRLYFQGF